VQRLFGGAPQSRDPHFRDAAMDPGCCAARRTRGALRSIRGTLPYAYLKIISSFCRNTLVSFVLGLSITNPSDGDVR
jgi:hypothetical protein